MDLWELPPRARRIPVPGGRRGTPVGTTSACAENTTAGPRIRKRNRNYLRVRGEYQWVTPQSGARKELPPRARRIHRLVAAAVPPTGTTSACAENTGAQVVLWTSHRNYLRVRGEYQSYIKRRSRPRELPPRARRILHLQSLLAEAEGTTSACAENTSPNEGISWPWRNYLRVRGEY